MKYIIQFFILLSVLFIQNISAPENKDSIQNTSYKTSSKIDTVVPKISPGDIQREAIKKADFLTGNWKGTESLITADGVKREVEASDFAETKLNGIVIVFQGTVSARFSENGEPVIVYEGLGLLTYDINLMTYRLQHFGTDGGSADYRCTLTGKSLLCEETDRSGALTRVTISVDDSGRWVEKGERSKDGISWTQYFETIMNKVTKSSGG